MRSIHCNYSSQLPRPSFTKIGRQPQFPFLRSLLKMHVWWHILINIICSIGWCLEGFANSWGNISTIVFVWLFSESMFLLSSVSWHSLKGESFGLQRQYNSYFCGIAFDYSSNCTLPLLEDNIYRDYPFCISTFPSSWTGCNALSG